MDQKFFFNHGWRQAAQDGGGQEGFDLPEVQLYAPALKIELADCIGGKWDRIKERRDPKNKTGAKALFFNVRPPFASPHFLLSTHSLFLLPLPPPPPGPPPKHPSS